MLLICLSCRQKHLGPALLPETLGYLKGFDIEIMPPSHFIAGLKQRSMMVATKRNGELVAEFKTQCPGFASSAVIGAALTHAVVRITL